MDVCFRFRFFITESRTQGVVGMKSVDGELEATCCEGVGVSEIWEQVFKF